MIGVLPESELSLASDGHRVAALHISIECGACPEIKCGADNLQKLGCIGATES